MLIEKGEFLPPTTEKSAFTHLFSGFLMLMSLVTEMGYPVVLSRVKMVSK
jgi:hypothetical protein